MDNGSKKIVSHKESDHSTVSMKIASKSEKSAPPQRYFNTRLLTNRVWKEKFWEEIKKWNWEGDARKGWEVFKEHMLELSEEYSQEWRAKRGAIKKDLEVEIKKLEKGSKDKVELDKLQETKDQLGVLI